MLHLNRPPGVPNEIPLILRIARVATIAASIAALIVILAQSGAILGYPFDWGPDEGLPHDFAERLRHDPASLYPEGRVPFPEVYGPLLPVLLAGMSEEPSLAAGRGLAALWTLLGSVAAYRIVRRSAGPLFGLVGALGCLHPFSIMSWSLMTRSDGLMLSLWLWSGVFLLPRELRRGVDRLDSRRLFLGGLLLFLSCLSKITGIFHGLPLVLVWVLVDFRSFTRLAGLLGGLGALWVGSMQTLTHGSYVHVLTSWTQHGHSIEQARQILGFSVTSGASGLLTLTITVLLAGTTRVPVHRAPAWILVAGGLVVVPLLTKYGAAFNYTLPLLAGIGVLIAQAAARLAPRRPAAAAVIIAATAGSFLVAPQPRIPTAEDRRTADFFYSQTRGINPNLPILALTPDWLYVVRGQPVEIEGSSLAPAAALGSPEARTILARLQQARYGLVVLVPEFWPKGAEYRMALTLNYRLWGACRLGFFNGTGYAQMIFVPKGLNVPFNPPVGTRCAADPSSLPPPVYYFD